MISRAWLLSNDPETRTQARLGQFYRVARELSRNPLAMVGLTIIVLLLLVAAFAPWLAPYSAVQGELANRLQPPSAAHWMGTDELGRDILSRVIHGARITLMIVLLVYSWYIIINNIRTNCMLKPFHRANFQIKISH